MCITAHEFFEPTLNRSSFPLYELLQKGRYVRKIIRFKENYDDGRKRKHLNVLSLRRRNETWLWQNATAFATKPSRNWYILVHDRVIYPQNLY